MTTFEVISVIFCFVYFIYDSYKVIVKKELKTTWIIVSINFVIIFIIIYSIYIEIKPIHTLSENLLNLRFSWAFLALLLASIILKTNRFKRY